LNDKRGYSYEGCNTDRHDQKKNLAHLALLADAFVLIENPSRDYGSAIPETNFGWRWFECRFS